MNSPDWLASLAHIILIITTPVILVSSPLCLFVTPGFVRHEYACENVPEADRFSEDERLRISDTIVRYLRGGESLQGMASVHTTTGDIALRAEEVQHLVDVKGVMDAFFLAHRIAVILAPVSLLLLWHSSRRALLPTYLRQGVFVTGGLIALVLVSSFIDFDVFFTRFHQAFFAANTWLFYEQDTLIQLYPLPFWVDTVSKLRVTILGEAGLVCGLSLALRRSACSQRRDR